ncbi:sensor histidine kinase [Spirochaeta africana]|uniref:histidine kinase n=1 Tax=Spirochaeta africana (strain ATCC 700263 / DSM 8902 / Z-7692) TaxID=889378 RepID=H9UMG5_SPIAZ|nr:histidine kinase dimerization/phosphoacceptor domain -containing protein [Spirochaeta africana]AFG38708.1 signal transduction histidine kinase [Spirochaeta africana DSM 8902]
MSFRSVSIRQLLLLTTCIAVLPALTIIIWAGIEHGTTLEQDVRNRSQREVELLTLLQETISTSISQTLTTLAALPAFQQAELERQPEILRSVLERNPGYVNIAYTDTQGIVQTSALLDVGTDLSERRHVRQALAGQEPAAGEYVLAFVGEVPSLPYAVPVRNPEGEIIGALTAVYRLTEYARALPSFELPESSLLLILDHAGTVLYSSHPEVAPGTRGCAELLNGVDSRIMPSLEIDETGTRRFFSARSLQLPGDPEPYLHIILGIPEDIARRPVRRTILRNSLLMLAAGLASIWIALRISDRLIGSGLRRLQHAVRELERGNLSARPRRIPGPRELVQVADGIHRMAIALEQRSQERDETEEALAKTLGENRTLLREVHHRVKNNMQLILSMVYLERETSTDFDSFITQLGGRIAAMAGVHELLYESRSLSRVEISSFLGRLTELTTDLYSQLEVETRTEQHAVELEQAVPLALITNELLTNAAKYGRSADGTAHIVLSFLIRNDLAELRIRDRGPGLPDDIASPATRSLGVTLLQMLAGQLGGTVVFGGDDSGADITIRYPVHPD